MYCEKCGTKVEKKRVYYCPSCNFALRDTRSKFLRFMFMCHRRPDRSFFIKGEQMPICARCTGICVGYIIGIFLSFFVRNKSFLIPILLVAPTTIDGFGQLLEKWTSNNIRRCITGIIAGIGLILFLQALFFLGIKQAEFIKTLI